AVNEEITVQPAFSRCGIGGARAYCRRRVIPLLRRRSDGGGSRSWWWSSRPPPSSQAVGGDRRFCCARRVTVSPKTQSLLKCPNVPGAGEPLASAGDQRCSEARKCASRGRERKGNSNEESSVCFGRDSRCGKRCWLRRHRQGQGPPARRDQGLT